MTIGKNQAPYKAFAKLFCTYSPRERLVRLGRIVWANGKPGQPGGGYSAKLSLGLHPRLLSFKRGWNEWCASILGVRIHYQRSYGGWMALFLIAALIGCAAQPQPAAAQSKDAEQDARLTRIEQLIEQHHPGSYTPGTTTGGTTTGGTTTGGTTTGGSTTGGTTTGGTTTGGTPTDRVVIFSTTHESGNLSTWNFGRQAVYDSGNGKTSLVQISNAKSGLWALRQTVTADDTSGARCFITGDKDNKAIPKQLYMTAWLYIPKSFKVGSWWNHMQLKERTSVSSNDGYVDPTLHLSLASNNTGLYQRIYNWIPGQRYYINQDPAKIVYLPIAKWTKIEWYVDSKTSGGSTWLKQDDVLIISRDNIKTIANDSHVLNFSVDCYGGRGPGFVQYYWDDVELSTPR